MLAGGFAPWTNYAAWALIGTAAVKIGLGQSLNWRHDGKVRANKDQSTAALSSMGFPIASAAMAAAMGLLTLAVFTFNTPSSLRSAAVIFTVAHVILDQDRVAANAGVAILQAACALIPFALAFSLNWDWFAPVPLAAIASVALALVLKSRARQRKICRRARLRTSNHLGAGQYEPELRHLRRRLAPDGGKQSVFPHVSPDAPNGEGSAARRAFDQKARPEAQGSARSSGA